MDSENQRHLSVGGALENVRLNRRQLLKRSIALGLTVPAVSTLLSACGGDDEDEPTVEDEATVAPEGDEPTAEADGESDDPTAEADGEDDDPTAETGDATSEGDTSEPSGDAANEERFGGTLEIALVDEIPTFDPHQTTASIIGFVVWQMYEHLYTYDEEFNIIPELAEARETSDDGLTYTITLRQGVPFHNGSEMTAADVVACMERWGELAGRGQLLFEDVEEITQVDDYTIDVQLSAPSGVFWSFLARHNNGCCIYPKTVIDAVGLEPIEEYTGTGPFRFVEYAPDAYVHMERFDDYARLEGEPNGWGGAKYAYVDEIYFRAVPDEAARVAALQAGDYHILQSTSPDNYQVLSNDSNVVAEFLSPASMLTIQLNTEEGPMVNPLLRQAVQAALNHEPIMLAAYGDAESFRLEASWMPEELGIWYTEACAEFYNRNDPERSAELLAEAGYDGEPLRFITSEHENFHINTALTAQQQLGEVGINVEIEVYDWPTLSGEIRQDMSRWEFLTSGTSIRPDPSLFSPMDPQWGARWNTEGKQELLDQLMSETDEEARIGIWEEIQCLGYEEDVSFINVGKANELAAYSPKVQGYRPDLNLVNAFFWNVWLED